MRNLLTDFKSFLAHRFNLTEDKAPDTEIIESIRKNVEFRGVNLWALIFAIFIACIGLNVNSTAVIIGAMLISPIMGPVMGVGLGISINDLTLVKKGAKNLFVATIISLLASTAYFLITPLHEAQSELLARTSPSVWDVLIAFFGGSAGMVAASRKEKSNVIPGVAIATALMPPLCTAGFGIATSNWAYALGALYLYFINSVFIAVATYLMARNLKMRHKHVLDEVSRKRFSRYMIAIVVITIAPSILMTIGLVNKSIFETNAGKFVDEQFTFDNTQVVSRSFKFTAKGKTIDLLLVGKDLHQSRIDSLKRNLVKYNLKNVDLIIHQGLNAKRQIDLSQIKASILEDVSNQAVRHDTVTIAPVAKTSPDSAVFAELKILYPQIYSFGLNRMVIRRADSLRKDTVNVALARFKTDVKNDDKLKLESWLKIRYHSPRLKLVVEK
jgi:uncharacterized hydrophobic protein (TIGR00271 family)